jgi:hypothetical protein
LDAQALLLSAELSAVCTRSAGFESGAAPSRFRTIGTYIPPPPGVKPPSLWSTEERLYEMFGDQISELTLNRREFVFHYRSAAHWLYVFRPTTGRC